jgi:phosphoribosylformimino-5-aminoimidazole carboxamide ribotide isomerase
MEIWPAIDLLNGKCVRLKQGDYARETVYGDDPAEMARRWFQEGASLLHCVDLDGARSGSIANEASIRGIVSAATGHVVQLGGGVRDEATIQRLLSLGVSRLVVGTAALKNPAWFGSMCQRYPGHLVLGLDARDGKVATEGWLETSSLLATDLIRQIAEHTQDCVAVIYTDIARDGMMIGPNFDQLVQMQQASPFPVIASGGVTTLEDIDRLVSLNTHGAILGKTLYEGHLKLSEVLSRAA